MQILVYPYTGIKVNDIAYKINHILVSLLFYNFAFKELHYHTICLTLVTGETAYQPIITGRWVF